MINVSDNFQKKLENDERDYVERIDMVLSDDTELQFTNKDIWGSSFTIDDAVGGDGAFSAVGSAIINSCSFTLNNIYDEYSLYDFTDAIATVYIGLDLGDHIEYVQKGVFTVNETTYNGSMINIKMFDNMCYFDKPYTASPLVYETGVELREIVLHACEQCGVTLDNSSKPFPNWNYVVYDEPSGDSTTFREVIAWCAAIAGCFARCNANGKLEIRWFDVDAISQASQGLDGGKFDPAVSIQTSDKIISTHLSANGLTLDYDADTGWWHIVGTPNTTQAIEFPLYEDVISQKQDTYTLRIETRDLNSRENPLNIGMNYWPDDESILYDVVASPYVTAIYSLTELSLVIPEVSSGRYAFDGYARIIVEKGNTTSYTSGDVADGGTFNPWNTGYVIDMGNDFVWGNVHYISSTFNKNIGVDDIVITDVAAEVKTQATGAQSGVKRVHYVNGEEGYTLLISGNGFINETNAQTIVDYLGLQLKGLKFRKADVSHLSDPTIEAGDVAFVFDKGNTFPILITRTTFKVGSAQNTVCGAENPLRNSASRFAESVKAYVDLRKRIHEQKSAQDELARKLAEAQGMYYSEEEDPDNPGSYIRYLHDKEDLSDSDIQIKFSNVGIHVTSNGTADPPDWYGLEVDGTFVANQLYSVGINADYINAGAITIRDGNQNETFYANTRTGAVRINADIFKVKVGGVSSTVQDIANAAANSAAGDALTNANAYSDAKLGTATDTINGQLGDLGDEITRLQNQLDNQITIHYEAYAPTTQNLPASDWIAHSEEADHEGEVFCDTTTGYSYRWFKTNNVWGWQQIADTGTAQAIAAARDASTLASQKKRVFISQPTPPYESGDLWVQGYAGDIMRCKSGISRDSESSYVATDWEKASKYTDDTAVNNLQIGSMNLIGDTQRLVDSSSVQNLIIEYESDGWWHIYGTYTRQSTETHSGNLYGRIFDDPGGGEYTISCERRGTNINDVRLRFYYNSTPTRFGFLDSIQMPYTIPTAYRLYSISFSLSAGTPYGQERSIDGYIRLIVVKGNKATSWSPSPADVSAEITKAVTDMQGTLEQQIDGKVQTWVSNTDPSTYWTADQKAENVDDLWYYTGKSIQGSWQSNNTYRYTSDEQDPPTYSWTSYAAPDGLFDAIDGKTTIYYSTPSDSTLYAKAQHGDYLVDSTDGKTYRWNSQKVEANKWVTVTDYQTAITSSLNNFITGRYANDLSGLETMIVDSTIETWYQDTDPSDSSWGANHTGDIWYCTATTGDKAQQTWMWQWNEVPGTDSWELMTTAPPQEVFDQIDGKAQIFIGDTTPVAPAEGDLWFKSANDPILTYTDGQWLEYNKYTDDTVANAVSDNLDRVEKELSTEIEQLNNSVTISITETNDNLDEIKTHYRFDETGETIGKSNSQKSIKLSNNGIDMMVNGESVTNWNQDEMYTPTRVRVPTGGSLQLGDFIFQPRSSGNISLLFVGGD